jgi:hypothetical protein
MWTFHLFFAMTLAPLFVKIWRIRQLIGMSRIRRTTISNEQAAMHTMPMILGQAVILTIFTFVDPPKQTEIIENVDGVVLQRIVCDTDTDALFITELMFEAACVIVGCTLAYLTRNLNDEFGEAKQLIFAMYNIALIGVIVILVMQVADIDGNGRSILQAVGVFWATVFSTAAFVIPRLLQVHRDQRAGRGRNRVVVSGISGVTPPPPITSNFDRESIIFDNSDRPGQSTILDNDEVDETPYDEVDERPPSITVGENEDKHESYTEQDDSSSDKPEKSANAHTVDWTGELHETTTAYLQNHEYDGKVLTAVAENPGECLKSEELKLAAFTVSD